MRLFVSYARVDKPYCVKIVDVLEDVHDVWYDHRIHAGQDWWQVIQDNIRKCEGFIYLISPESVKSEYCQKEFELACSLGKHVFPVQIHANAQVPDSLKHVQNIDLTKGLDLNAVKTLLNSILVLERLDNKPASDGHEKVIAEVEPAVPFDAEGLIADVAKSMDSGDYDRAVYLLKRARDNKLQIRFISLASMLQEAEVHLERQAYERQAEREYKPIVQMIRSEALRKNGCEAFQAFHKEFPGYDPEDVGAVCAVELMPMLEWIDIPPGEVTIQHGQKKITYFVDGFKIARYPVTNAQYQAFIDAEDGYKNPQWWDSSPHAEKWFKQHPRPLQLKVAWGEHPRSRVSFYEAEAFARWLSARTGWIVDLPTEQQWQRAAQGDDNRLYPWGSRFNKAYCNCKPTGLRAVSKVNEYDKGVSPFGVYDMAGNIWEWCDSVSYENRNGGKGDEDLPRAVRGGSFISVAQRLRNTYHFYLAPHYQYPTNGFRLAIP